MDSILKCCTFTKQFRALKFSIRWTPSFGLASDPRVFTILLTQVLVLLRSWEIALTGCLNNCLLQAESHSVLMDNLVITMQTLQKFSWVLNLKKFALTPSGYLKYLGLILNVAQAKALLPLVNLWKLWTAVHLLLSYLYFCMQVLSLMVSTPRQSHMLSFTQASCRMKYSPSRTIS